jgi:glutamate racemase
MIGIFDSGLGGLTAYRELRLRRPDLDILYYADTAHIPYGNRSREEILRYAQRALAHLVSLGADSVLVACGTVSSVALSTLQEHSPIPLFGVIVPTAHLAYHLSQSKHIGILATRATIASHAFETALSACGHTCTYAVPCPLLVSLVEEGFVSPREPLAREAVAYYLTPLMGTQVDALILGCTHFSHLAPHFARLLPRVALIGAGEAAAAHLCSTCPKVGSGITEFYVTQNPKGFERAASRLLGMMPTPHIHLIKTNP